MEEQIAEGQKKTKLFIDFDDTLFNRNLFARRLFDILGRFQLTEVEKMESYKAVYKAGYAGILPHLEKLAELYPGKVSQEKFEEAKKGAMEFLSGNNLRQYLFPEAEKFLAGIDREKYDVFLITVGGVEFQKAKVEGSGVAKFFDSAHLIYTDAIGKDEALSQLVGKDEEFVLLDDKQSTLDTVKEKFPNSVVVQAGGGDLLRHLDPEASVNKESSEATISDQPEDKTADPEPDSMTSPEEYGPPVR